MNRQPIRRYKRRGGGGATAAIIVLSVVVVLAFVCLILAITGRLDPLIDAFLPAPDDTGTETTDPDIGVTTSPTESDPPSSSAQTTAPALTDPPPVDPPVSGNWLSLTMEDTKSGLLVVVNNDHEYTFPKNSPLINFYEYRVNNGGSGKYQLTGSEVYLNADAASAVHRMLVECATVNAGANFFIQEAYRSYADQEGLYRPGSTGAFKPGCTDYHTGNAVYLKLWLDDGTGTFRGSELAADPTISSWIDGNAHKYGLIMRYPNDKKAFTGTITDGEGHYRYVGPIHAAAMKERDMCLEEYLIFLRDFTYSGNHLAVRTDAGDYEVYSVKLSEAGVTKVPVPEGEYTISGDNQGYVIITVPAGSDA